MYKVKAITNIEELIDLRDQWNCLLEKSYHNTIYLTWEWIVTWWKHFGEDKKLFILLVTKNEQIAAIFPLMKAEDRCLGLPLKKLKMISNDHTHYSDIIFSRGDEESLIALFKFLEDEKWDLVELGSILSNSASIEILERLEKQKIIRVHRGDAYQRHPYISFEDKSANFYDELPTLFKKGLRRRGKKLAEFGDVICEEHRQSDYLDELLEEAFKIESSSWKGEEGTAIACLPKVKDFYKEFAHIASAKDWLSLFFLKVNNKRIAFMLNFRYRNEMDSTKIGYDSNYSQCSPGSLLNLKCLEKAQKEGFARFNFLGKYTGHKKDWTKYTNQFSEVYIYKKTSYATFLYLVRFGIKSYFKRCSWLLKFKRYICKLLFKNENKNNLR